jgi:hypothetical protein
MTRELDPPTRIAERASTGYEKARSFLDIREPRAWLRTREADHRRRRGLTLVAVTAILAAALGLLILGME